MIEDPYLVPGTSVLRNKLGFTDAHDLDYAERLTVARRGKKGVPAGDFDLAHLRAIHHHLFQDVYDWAGEVRTVEISKGGSQFMFRQFIENGMADVHRRIVAAHCFRKTTREDFSQGAGVVMGDVNYAHPFREGNGRTQLLYLKQLAHRAGHRLDLLRVERDSWFAASRRACAADYAPMAACIFAAL